MRRGRALYVVPLAAAAVVALLLVRDPQLPAAHREGGAASGSAPVAIAPLGPTTTVAVLRWHGVLGADRYRVTVFDETGAVVYETTSTDTVVALPPAVELPAGRPHYWIVAARTDFDRWETSALAEFSTTEVPP
jgi:hypothetical protein